MCIVYRAGADLPVRLVRLWPDQFWANYTNYSWSYLVYCYFIQAPTARILGQSLHYTGKVQSLLCKWGNNYCIPRYQAWLLFSCRLTKLYRIHHMLVNELIQAKTLISRSKNMERLILWRGTQLLWIILHYSFRLHQSQSQSIEYAKSLLRGGHALADVLTCMYNQYSRAWPLLLV